MKTIYCTGDSFTHGTELADADHYGAQYPGYTTLSGKDVLRREKNRMWWIENTPAVSHSGILTPIENARAWPAKLMNYLPDVKTINAGRPGRSMQFIADNCIKDLIELNYEVDLVIVQNTDPSRLEFFDNNSSITLFLQNPAFNDTQEKLRNVLLTMETDESLYFRWLTQLAKVKDFCKVHNIPFLLVDSVNVTRHYKEKFDKIAYIEKYVGDAALSMIKIAQQFDYNALTVAAGGHFTEIVHDKFAAELSKIIQDRKLI